jgi:hypothetical protein
MIDRYRSRLIHHPSDDASSRAIVLQRSSPDVMKHIESEIVGGLAIVGDAHDQREHEAIGAVVQSPQRPLTTRGDRPDETGPFRLGDRSLGLVGMD